MKLGKLSEYYYTSAEARKVLGIDADTFVYWGREERVKRVYLPKRKQPVYLKSEIDELARETEATIPTEQRNGINFREATADDIEQEARLAGLVFGEKAEAREARKAFLQANPCIDYHLYDQNKLVAYIDIMPMKHESIMDFIEGRAIVWDISADNVEQFEPGKPVECLIADMITSPHIPIKKRTFYGRRLLVGLLRKVEEMGKQGIKITKIYAGSGIKTPQGLRIVRKAGFKEIYRRGEGKIMFELDVMNSDARIVRKYKEALNEWKESQEKVLTSTRPKSRTKREAQSGPKSCHKTL